MRAICSIGFTEYGIGCGLRVPHFLHIHGQRDGGGLVEAQIERLSREELEPRGLSVLVRHLVRGTARFIIKTTVTGEVWDMIEIEPNDVPTKNTWQVDPQGSNQRHLPPA